MIFFLPKLKFRKYPKPKGWGFCKSGLERERERERIRTIAGALLRFCGLCCCDLIVGIAAFSLRTVALLRFLWVVLLRSCCGHCCVFCCLELLHFSVVDLDLLQGTWVLRTRFPYKSHLQNSSYVELDSIILDLLNFLNSLEMLLTNKIVWKYMLFWKKKSQ